MNDKLTAEQIAELAQEWSRKHSIDPKDELTAYELYQRKDQFTPSISAMRRDHDRINLLKAGVNRGAYLDGLAQGQAEIDRLRAMIERVEALLETPSEYENFSSGAIFEAIPVDKLRAALAQEDE